MMSLLKEWPRTTCASGVLVALLLSLPVVLPGAEVSAARDAADKSGPTPVAVEEVPAAVSDAARKAVDGLTLTGAKRLGKKSQDVFRLEGTAGGKSYALRVDVSGRVLEVEGAKGGAKKGAAAKQIKPKGAAAVNKDAANSPARRIGTIEHGPVRESSGIVASRRHAGVYWTHNDRGNAPSLYAVTREGNLLAEFPVAGASADDWEDVAVDDHGHLYIGNIGNNRSKRDWLEVHRLAEPDPAAAGDASAHPLRPEKSWRLTFPGKPFDCESLFIRGDSGYVVSKLFTGDPAAIYRFPLNAAGETVLEKVADLPAVRTPVTAADLSADGRWLAVLSWNGLYLFDVDVDLRRAGEAKPKRVPVPAGKLEGVCFSPNGIMMTAESREVYLVAP